MWVTFFLALSIVFSMVHRTVKKLSLNWLVTMFKDLYSVFTTTHTQYHNWMLFHVNYKIIFAL